MSPPAWIMKSEMPRARRIFAARLTAVDTELRELQTTLGDERPTGTVVREPGVGGACPECGELHGSDARYCSHCGTSLESDARYCHSCGARVAA